MSSCWASHCWQPWARPSPRIRLSWRKRPSPTSRPLSGAASLSRWFMFHLDVQLPRSRSGHLWRAPRLPRAPREAEAFAVTAGPPSVSSAQELAILGRGPKKPPVTKPPAQNGLPGTPAVTCYRRYTSRVPHSAPQLRGLWGSESSCGSGWTEGWWEHSAPSLTGGHFRLFRQGRVNPVRGQWKKIFSLSQVQ